MSFLITDAARAFEDTRFGAFCLGVTAASSQLKRISEGLSTHPRLSDLPFFATVETRHALARFRTFTSEMSLIATAGYGSEQAN